MQKLIAAWALILSVCPCLKVAAQDTVVVQTLSFADITKRRGTYHFPPATERYRKVLMYYTLKCDAATTQDQYPCGEWDYLTYNKIYMHTGVMDSTAFSHPYFKVNGLAPASLAYFANPVFNYRRRKEFVTVIDNTVSQTQHDVGTGAQSGAVPFNASVRAGHAQFLYPAAELTAAGLTAGNIRQLSFDVTQTGAPLRGLRIAYKTTGSAALTGFDGGTFTELYKANTSVSATGTFSVTLTDPIVWDGTSNLLLDFSFDNAAAQPDHQLAGDNLSYNASASATYDGYTNYDNGKYIDVPLAGYDFGNEITVSFWCYGSPSQLPAGTSIFEATDNADDRSLNAHLPWSDGVMYWDAGAGPGYDRINKTAPVNVYEGTWNHWAFTKNATTGSMKIYLNGTLWHSGTGLTRPIGKIKEFRIGNAVTFGAPYFGKMDEFTVWKKELDAAAIQDWRMKDIDATHPNHADLVVYYKFNETAAVTDHSGNNRHGLLGNMPALLAYTPQETFKNVVVSGWRPKTRFTAGVYTTHLDSAIVTDTVLALPTGITTYAVNNHMALPTGTNTVWLQTRSYTYGINGNIVDSVPVAQAQQALNNYQLNYHGPAFEVIDDYEIGRYITPYGINLSLGANGFRWEYDITDYAFLLHDSVDLSAGNQQELIDLKFLLIKGDPPADVVKLSKIWGSEASYSYRNLDNDTSMKVKTLPVEPTASKFKVKTRITGHGHNSNDGSYPHCCEWKDNEHYLFVNGTQADAWHIWKTDKCALNPVYPQGGTWPGAREGWCPGDVVDEHETDITAMVSGMQVNVDYDITPVPAGNLGMGDGNYVINADFVQYKAPNHPVDAEVLNVVSPNAWGYLARVNPVCYNPTVVIRNNGNAPLTSATITYGVVGGTPKTFNWTGNLGFLKVDTVTLTAGDETFWVGDGSNRFYATVSLPNGVADQYAANDTYRTQFKMPDMYAENFVIEMKTNNYAYQNRYVIRDVTGTVVFTKENLSNNTQYKDTLSLPDGCYTFELFDSDNDGLKYWANTAQGNGSIRFRKYSNNVSVKSFNPEFGHSLKYSFTIGGYTSIQEPDTQKQFDVYPNPTQGEFTLDLINYSGMQTVQVYDLNGRLVFTDRFNPQGNGIKNYDLGHLKPGMYIIRLSDEHSHATKRLIIE